MICANCQTTNADGARFCRSCGNSLGRACSRCGAPLTAKDQYCSNCGQPADIPRTDIPQPAASPPLKVAKPVPPAFVHNHLNSLEAADLIRLAQVEPALEYLFRHALVQDAAYESLLKSDRQRLHRIVGQSLERLYPEREIELAPVLGHHFYEAGSNAEARRYFTLAGDDAARRYANAEAVAHYTRAIEVADAQDSSIALLYHARGMVYETLGDFPNSQADHESGLHIGRTLADHQTEWQALLDLGMLWASRDYDQAKTYLQSALDLAHQLGDPVMLGNSLNRMGNWYVNQDEPLEGLRLHQEALAIFEKRGDRQGVARTFDLLGMASLIGANLVSGFSYYRQAVGLFEEFGDLPALSSSLVGLGFPASASFQVDTLVPGEIAPGKARARFESALAIAREIGWRAGESFALCALAWEEGARGEIMRGIELGNRAYAVAEEIQHRQWMVFSLVVLGSLYSDLFDLGAARSYLEQASRLAHENRSLYWMQNAGAMLARLYLRQGLYRDVETILRALLTPTMPAQSLGQRLLWSVHAELALAQGDIEGAMRSLDHLVHYATNLEDRGENALLRVALLRGQALTAIIAGGGHWSPAHAARAETALRAGRDLADSMNVVTLTWQFRVVLGQLYRHLGRQDEASQQTAAAQAIVDGLATKIDREDLRQMFLNGAARYIQSA